MHDYSNQHNLVFFSLLYRSNNSYLYFYYLILDYLILDFL